VLIAKSSRISFECRFPELLGEKFDFFTLNVKNESVSIGRQTLFRELLIIAMRVVLTLFLEGLFS
jgi:hypothetical protein